MDYEDLVIQLGTGAGGYTVRVSRSPAGETDPETLDLAVEAAEIEGLARIFADATRDLGQLAAAEVAAPTLIALGDRLLSSPRLTQGSTKAEGGLARDLPYHGGA